MIVNEDMDQIASKACVKCGVEKPVTDFFKCGKNSINYRGKCKMCMQADHKDYTARNRDRHNAYRRAYNKRKYAESKSNEPARNTATSDNADDTDNADNADMGDIGDI